MVPVPLTVPVPVVGPSMAHRLDATYFCDGHEPIHAAARNFGLTAATVVVLSAAATAATGAALMAGVRHAVAHGQHLVLVHAGAGGGSLLQTLCLERPNMSAIAIETVPSRAGLQTAGIFARAAPMSRYREVVIDSEGHATQPGWRELPWPSTKPALAPGDRVVVTGGAGGLGSAVAQRMAQRYGVIPMIIDISGAGSEPARRVVQSFRSRGLPMIHISADVTKPDVIAPLLSETRGDGVIRGIVHCAGSILGRRVAELDVSVLDSLAAPKVTGLRSVLAAVDIAGVHVVLAFGSVLARFPHPRVGAYAYANELLRRTVARASTQFPGPRYLTAEWTVWDGAGMAFAMGATSAAGSAGYSPLALDDGLNAVERLLGWPAPSTSALVAGTVPGLRPYPTTLWGRRPWTL